MSIPKCVTLYTLVRSLFYTKKNCTKHEIVRGRNVRKVKYTKDPTTGLCMLFYKAKIRFVLLVYYCAVDQGNLTI